jgi:hypothetical protein
LPRLFLILKPFDEPRYFFSGSKVLLQINLLLVSFVNQTHLLYSSSAWSICFETIKMKLSYIIWSNNSIKISNYNHFKYNFSKQLT